MIIFFHPNLQLQFKLQEQIVKVSEASRHETMKHPDLVLQDMRYLSYGYSERNKKRKKF